MNAPRFGLQLDVRRYRGAADLRAQLDALLDAGFKGWLCTTHAVYYASPAHREWVDGSPPLSGELTLGERSYHLRWSDAGDYLLTESREVEGDDYEVAEHTFVAIRPNNVGGPQAARGRDTVRYRAYWPATLNDADLDAGRQVGPVTARLVDYHLHSEGEQ